MAIPGYQSVMLPLLKLSSDGAQHSIREAIDSLARVFKLSDSDRREVLPSGRQAVFDNRVGWARTYMKKAGLLTSPQRGYFQITPRGRKVLTQGPARIDVQFLDQFCEFREFRRPSNRAKRPGDQGEPDTPEETLESAYESLRAELADELLRQVKATPPSLFEKIVVRLLVEMGYGGNLRDAGKAIGGSGDEGIDGVIKEDPLGLDIIYVQAKRWEGTVGRPEVQRFAGALQGQRARKGVFITTSLFSRDACDYVSRIDARIVLVDGPTLTQSMIDHGIGVSLRTAYEVKALDLDYFTE